MEEIMYLTNAFLIGAVILLVMFAIMAFVAFMLYAAEESASHRVNKIGQIFVYILLSLFLILAAIAAGDKYLNMK